MKRAAFIAAALAGGLTFLGAQAEDGAAPAPASSSAPVPVGDSRPTPPAPPKPLIKLRRPLAVGEKVRTSPWEVPVLAPGTPYEPMITSPSADVMIVRPGNPLIAPLRKPGNPEQVKLYGELQSLEREVREIADKYSRSEHEDADREEAGKMLRKLLKRQFDLRQQLRDQELAQLEQQLSRLRDLQARRRDQREQIIDDRERQLLRDADGLGWGEEGNWQSGPNFTWSAGVALTRPDGAPGDDLATTIEAGSPGWDSEELARATTAAAQADALRASAAPPAKATKRREFLLRERVHNSTDVRFAEQAAEAEEALRLAEKRLEVAAMQVTTTTSEVARMKRLVDEHAMSSAEVDAVRLKLLQAEEQRMKAEHAVNALKKVLAKFRREASADADDSLDRPRVEEKAP